MARPREFDRDEWVSASEIGTHAYCARSHWLARARGAAPSEGSARRRAAGTAAHARHGSRAAAAGRLARAAVIVAGAGAALLVVLALWTHLR